MAQDRAAALARSADAAGGGTAPSRRPPADHHRGHTTSHPWLAAFETRLCGKSPTIVSSQNHPAGSGALRLSPSAPLACAEREAALVAASGRTAATARTGACSRASGERYALPREGVQWHDDEASLACKSIGRTASRAISSSGGRARADGDDGGTMRGDVLYREGDPGRGARVPQLELRRRSRPIVVAAMRSRLRSGPRRLAASRRAPSPRRTSGRRRQNCGFCTSSRPGHGGAEHQLLMNIEKLDGSRFESHVAHLYPRTAGAADRGRRCPGAFSVASRVRSGQPSASMKLARHDQALTSTSFTPAT